MPARRPRKRWSARHWVLLAGGVLLVIAILAAWLAFGRPAAPASTTEVARVTRDTQVETVALSGTIEPRDQAEVTFKVPGTVNRVYTKVGKRVKKGERLARVGTRDLTDAVTLARANVAAARAQLTTARDTSGATRAQINAAQAQVNSAEASLSSALNRLDDAVLRAPIAGTVAEVSIQVGDEVSGSTGTPSLPTNGGTASGGSLPSGLGGLTGTASATDARIVIVSTKAWQLQASVGTADLPRLAAGQDATITPTGTSRTVAGQVDTVGIVADQTSGATATFPVTVSITDATDQLYSGSSADAVVTVGEYPGVLTVPASAVTTVDGRSTVRRLSGATPSPVEVTVGRRFGGRLEITAGLSEGDEVEVPKGQVITAPPRPQFGPPSASPSR